jgi:periplasmic glucans biosynthesis protein
MFLPATTFLSVPLSRLPSQRPLRWAALAALWVGVLVAPSAEAFSFDDVALRARQLSALPYKKPVSNLPRELQGITYDQYRDIRFRPEKSYWRNLNLPFELAFFHQGLYYDQPVKINEIVNSAVREIRFRPELFDYGANKIDPKRLTGIGFAGFRVHYAINATKYKDEVLVFLGASYFRALGRNQLYGLSARALAIDTALPSGEEFPRFVEFWIEAPTAGAKELTIYALVDSRRVTGAYRFVVKPGVDTVMDVKSQLYLRENVSILGLAPLTSMYLFGENQPRRVDDYRPEVHDSDGLSIQSGTGEWLWRPLSNPKRLLITSFALTNPLGFGLMQRDRDFGRYEDLEARYDRRPSAWVVPKGNWGTGRVELIQIPTPDETNDNIVAFWVPESSPGLQKPFDVEYRLLWQKDSETRPPLSWVVQTRRGHGYSRDPDPTVGFVVDFEGPALRRLAADAVVDPVVTADANGEIVERVAQRNEVTGGWRMRVRVKRVADDKPVELRGFLRSGTNTLSETWSYVLAPE